MDAEHLVSEPISSESETDRVERWRLCELLRVGYSISDAEQLAVRTLDIDLHYATDLVDTGCPPAIAAQILL